MREIQSGQADQICLLCEDVQVTVMSVLRVDCSPGDDFKNL